MKAWMINSYGGPEVLQPGEVPEPDVGPNDVLISVRAASVNPIDWKMRSGETRVILKQQFPLILGNDASGIVESVGSDVQAFNPGDRVYTRPDKRRVGTFAERIAVSASDVAIMPPSLSFEQAASIPLVGLTAWQALVDLAKIQPGQKVLVHAGAGGVGTFAIQLAKHLGAYVATTASQPKHELLKTLGADLLIDYRSQDFTELISDFDLVFDLLGGREQKQSFSTLKPGGLLVSIVGPPDPPFAREWELGWPLRILVSLISAPVRIRAQLKKCNYRFLIMSANGEQLGQISQLIERRRIRPVIDRVFPFVETDKAVAYTEQGHAPCRS
jgi:NADPH:quinone reductase-like Zn-dependent oxidoreductase